MKYTFWKRTAEGWAPIDPQSVKLTPRGMEMAAKHLAYVLHADIRVFRELRGGLGVLVAEVAK